MSGIGVLHRTLHRDYFSAVAFWTIGRTLRLQVHQVLCIDLDAGCAAPASAPGMRLLAVRNEQDLAAVSPAIEEQLDEQSGPSCRSILARGGALYAIAEGERIACQLNIRRGTVQVDSPTTLTLAFPPGSAFLDFLHTREAFRGRGLAAALIRHACADIARHGTQRCFAHVRATNHSSLRAFRRAGWRRCAAILTTRSGRYIAAPGCLRAGMQVTTLVVSSA